MGVIEGNQTLLRSCASASNMYFEVAKASQLDAVFKSIADSLVTLHNSNRTDDGQSGDSVTAALDIREVAEGTNGGGPPPRRAGCARE